MTVIMKTISTQQIFSLQSLNIKRAARPYIIKDLPVLFCQFIDDRINDTDQLAERCFFRLVRLLKEAVVRLFKGIESSLNHQISSHLCGSRMRGLPFLSLHR